ncbi:MAG: DUF4177 domain-containing protein [Polyangiaceae bacterium]|nr:DUF4177 domain-containing protein [Polyangiaceae bacterium]
MSTHDAETEGEFLLWEYKILTPKLSLTGKLDPEALEEQLNRLGAEGWELAATTLYGGSTHGFVCKRPLS